jgi:hypothetical protein
MNTGITLHKGSISLKLNNPKDFLLPLGKALYHRFVSKQTEKPDEDVSGMLSAIGIEKGVDHIAWKLVTKSIN